MAILRECKRKLNNAQTDDSQRERQIDLLRYQINEIEEIDPKEGEYEQLTEERNKALNAQDIIKNISVAAAILSGGEDGSGCISLLKECSDYISEISEYMPQSENISRRISNVYYELQDCEEELSSLLDTVDTNPYRLEEIEERLDLLYKLSKSMAILPKKFCSFAKMQK